MAAALLDTLVARRTEELFSGLRRYATSRESNEGIRRVCFDLLEGFGLDTRRVGKVIGGREYLGRVDLGSSRCYFAFLLKHETTPTYWRISFYRAREHWALSQITAGPDVQTAIERNFMAVAEVRESREQDRVNEKAGQVQAYTAPNASKVPRSRRP